MSDPDTNKVEQLIREVAARLIMPRFRSLDSAQIDEKTGPMDLVTVADREAEEALAPALEAMVPGSRAIGEEMVGAGRVSLDLLHGDGSFWLIDPVDGTYNFVSGSDRFGVMVAFIRGGRTRAGWIFYPAEGRCLVAEEGSGAFLGDERLTKPPARPFETARGDFSHTYVQEPYRSVWLQAVENAGPVRQGRCSAYAYGDLVRGALDYVLQYIMTPWDHAPGHLITEEAGGRFGFLPGGEPYTPIGRNARPMLAAASAEMWDSYAQRFCRAL